MEYNFRQIEKKWQQKWKETNAYKVSNESTKPKYYVLDMFPYPSGAGLHVGHPLGYIASDIYARYKRLKGFNVLHPMGFDSFGLPAEQYAIETGQHPAVTTEKNIQRYHEQLDNIGFCYDWSREVRTSDPSYYKWTQYIFLQLFNSWYNRKANKTERIETLIKIFEIEGNRSEIRNPKSEIFTAEDWRNFEEARQQEILMNYRIAFSAFGEVNWCEALGTVLANDEVVNGVSERGGHPVEKKKMRQWYLRITEYADRLLQGLEQVDFSDAMKEMQRNWIGKSQGAEIQFKIQNSKFKINVYTTRPDTIFGVDFMVVAPEHEMVKSITSEQQKTTIDDYLTYVKSRSERERLAEVKSITGAFTGAYAINPFDGREIPIWISEYVLAGYGTGAIMAVPCGDQRDFSFAKHFNISITNIIGDGYTGEEANATKDATLQNSDFLDGMLMKDAIDVVITKLEEMGIGKRQVNYRMRDAGFSRQRYWGEPFPIVYKNGVAYPLSEKDLPVELPYAEKYGPGPEGEGPLANITEWFLIPDPSPQVEKGAPVQHASQTIAASFSEVPKYSVHSPMQFELAKQNRKGHTEAEARLWESLRGNNLGEKFRRQHPIDAYIADFICLQKRLIVEVDGGYHENEEQKIYDEHRTSVLTNIGFRVIRFTNHEVIDHLPTVTTKIKEILNKEGRTEAPLSTRGEGPGVRRETNTMPGYAGSSWYFLRYMDPNNDEIFVDKKIADYWNQVDLYIGGTEHAVGHLLYSRMWTKALYDLGYISFEEPYKKLVNQGMIQGRSALIYMLNPSRVQVNGSTSNAYSFYISKNLRHILNESGIRAVTVTEDKIDFWNDEAKVFEVADLTEVESNSFNTLKDFVQSEMIDQLYLDLDFLFIPIHVDISLINESTNTLDINKFKSWKPEFQNARFILEHGECVTEREVEKMSKSKYNVVNPDDIVERYGADTFRMYEMFLGPIDQSKPWDTKGIEGVHRFLRKFWRLFVDETKGLIITNDAPTEAEFKVLHKTIKKIEDDTERFSFNTAVSTFMIAVNELGDLKCRKKDILQPLLILLTPYAPHIAEELWNSIGAEGSVLDAAYPKLEEKYLVESSKEYPISINGKLRTNMNIALDAIQSDVEQLVLSNEIVQKWVEGKQPKKIIYVKGKMINIVI